MYGGRSARRGDGEDSVCVEVALLRPRPADAEGFIREANVEGIGGGDNQMEAIGGGDSAVPSEEVSDQ